MKKKSGNGSAVAKYSVKVRYKKREEPPALTQLRSRMHAKIMVDVATRKKLAEFLRLRRQELGLTQRKAGKLANPPFDAATITNMERTGRMGNDSLMRYAKALGCQIPEDLILKTQSVIPKEPGKSKVHSTKLGQFLIKRRKQLGLSRADIANALGTHWSPIYRWEKALVPISDVYLDAWAEVLRCSPADLRALANDQEAVTRVIVLKKEDSEHLDFLLQLGHAPDSSQVVKESCKFLYSFLLMKALNHQDWNPHLFSK